MLLVLNFQVLMTKISIKITFRRADRDEKSQNEWKRFVTFRSQCDNRILILMLAFNAVCYIHNDIENKYVNTSDRSRKFYDHETVNETVWQ